MSINRKIALAIKRADKSYFFENYDKQAKSVIKALDKEGYKIVPKDFDDDIYKQVADTMSTGKMRPEEHVKDVYTRLLGFMQAK